MGTSALNPPSGGYFTYFIWDLWENVNPSTHLNDKNVQKTWNIFFINLCFPKDWQPHKRADFPSAGYCCHACQEVPPEFRDSLLLLLTS